MTLSRSRSKDAIEHTAMCVEAHNKADWPEVSVQLKPRNPDLKLLVQGWRNGPVGKTVIE